MPAAREATFDQKTGTLCFKINAGHRPFIWIYESMRKMKRPRRQAAR
jgi:hypothetical protein